MSKITFLDKKCMCKYIHISLQIINVWNKNVYEKDDFDWTKQKQQLKNNENRLELLPYCLKRILMWIPKKLFNKCLKSISVNSRQKDYTEDAINLVVFCIVPKLS